MKKRRKKYRLKKWVKVTLWILLLLVILIIGIKVINKQRDHNKKVILKDISYLRSKYNNPDIMARMVIEGINLEAIITKTVDNDYYLEYDINKIKNPNGNPYIDYRNSNDLAHEKQINIYGHNVENKQYKEFYPFANLEDLLDKEIFYKSNDLILYTDNRIIKYQIVGIKIVTSNDNEHMRISMNSLDDWKIHFDKLLTNTKYKRDNIVLDSNDELLILQTCYYAYDDSYIIVIAKKV